jgi:hypothetical protein
MRENVGRVDRIARTVIGPSLIALGYARLRSGHLTGILGIVAGALVLESAITRVCPLNALLGLDTRSTAERIRDFRGDVNEQSDRIASEYSPPIQIDEVSPAL